MIIRHMSPSDIAIMIAAVTYIVLQVKDYRPIRSLRAENSEQRRELDELRGKYVDLKSKYVDLEHRYQQLEKSRDFETSFQVAIRAVEGASERSKLEHEQMITAIKAHEEKESRAWTEIQRGLAANTAALSALAAGIHAAA